MFTLVYKCITANASAIWQHGGKLHIPPTNLLLLAPKQEPYKKANLLMKNTEEFSGKKVQQNGPAGSRKKDKTRRATGLGRRTRKEIVKQNQVKALRFQTGGKRQTSPASLQGALGRHHTNKKGHNNRDLRHLW